MCDNSWNRVVEKWKDSFEELLMISVLEVGRLIISELPKGVANGISNSRVGVLCLLLENLNEVVRVFFVVGVEVLTDLRDGHNCSVIHFPVVLSKHLVDITLKEIDHFAWSNHGQ